jgi:hypothetical protein
MHRPFTDQSPKRVGSGPLGPPISSNEFFSSDGRVPLWSRLSDELVAVGLFFSFIGFITSDLNEMAKFSRNFWHGSPERATHTLLTLPS